MEILNGQRWKSPSLLEAITQWLDRDTWVLMSVPYKSRHGWPAQMPMSEEDGKIFFTAAALADRLTRNGWQLQKPK